MALKMPEYPPEPAMQSLIILDIDSVIISDLDLGSQDNNNPLETTLTVQPTTKKMVVLRWTTERKN